MLPSHLAFGAGQLKWVIRGWWKYMFIGALFGISWTDIYIDYWGEKRRTKLANKAWHCKQGGSPPTERGTWRGWELPESSFSQSNPKSGKYGIKKQSMIKYEKIP